MGATRYALCRGEEFVDVGTAQELARRHYVSVNHVYEMASEAWQEAHPESMHAFRLEEFAKPRDEARWHVCERNDRLVHRMREQGVGWRGIASQLGISVLMAKNAYMRVENGRWG